MISTLEKLKNEAAEVARKAAETDKVMAEASLMLFIIVRDINCRQRMKITIHVQFISEFLKKKKMFERWLTLVAL